MDFILSIDLLWMLKYNRIAYFIFLAACRWTLMRASLAYTQKCRKLEVFFMACFCMSLGHHTSCLVWLVESGVIEVLLHELVRLVCLLFHTAAKIIKDRTDFIQCVRFKWLWSQLLFVLRGPCVLLHFSTKDMKAPFDVLNIFCDAHCATISSIFWKLWSFPVDRV